MAIAPTFQKYLATKNVRYDIVAHEPTKSSMRTAEACQSLATVSPRPSCFAMSMAMCSPYCRRHTTYA